MKGLLLLAVAIVLVILWCSYKKDNSFSSKDHKYGEEVVRELFTMLDQGKEPPEISDEELAKLTDEVFMIVTPKDGKENLSYFNAVNTRYWPYYYYSFPYNYKYGGAWPPGMYSRLYFWSPGFYTGTGWTYYMRPGIGYKSWQRNTWLRNNGSYYNVTNRGDYVHDAASYNKLPLVFN